MWIVRAYYSPLVVAVEDTEFYLKKPKFEEKGLKPNYLSCTMRARNVFGFA